MNCQLCNRDCTFFIDEKTTIKYHYCHHCAYIFKDPITHLDFTIQKARYDLHENSEANSGYQAYFQRFLDFILPLTGKPVTVLDFGCGASTLLAQMLSKEGVACDYYDPIYHPKAEDNGKKYELIVSTEVFEHLHQPKEVFKMLLERLEEGGYLALQTEFHPNDVTLFKKWYYHQDPTHIAFFTAQTFSRLSEMFSCEFIGDNRKNMVVIQKK